MKKCKTKQLRVRINESQLQNLVSYIIDHPGEYKTKSELVRESIREIICRKKNINQKDKSMK